MIIGCMFAGKTSELIRKVQKLWYAGYQYQIFKPFVDDRTKSNIKSHTDLTLPSITVKSSQEIINKINADTDVIAIDEIQFFDQKIVSITQNLVNKNKIVICAGLDKDFRGVPFLNITKMLPLSEFIIKLNAVCVVCGNSADRTQRIINDKYAPWNDKIIMIGGNNYYEARCRFHHVIKKP